MNMIEIIRDRRRIAVPKFFRIVGQHCFVKSPARRIHQFLSRKHRRKLKATPTVFLPVTFCPLTSWPTRSNSNSVEKTKYRPAHATAQTLEYRVFSHNSRFMDFRSVHTPTTKALRRRVPFLQYLFFKFQSHYFFGESIGSRVARPGLSRE